MTLQQAAMITTNTVTPSNFVLPALRIQPKEPLLIFVLSITKPIGQSVGQMHKEHDRPQDTVLPLLDLPEPALWSVAASLCGGRFGGSRRHVALLRRACRELGRDGSLQKLAASRGSLSSLTRVLP